MKILALGSLAQIALFGLVSPAMASSDFSTCNSSMSCRTDAPILKRFKVAAEQVCSPGISRCGADGYVERCSYDGASWTSSLQKCK
jgi:hypothetical protein